MNTLDEKNYSVSIADEVIAAYVMGAVVSTDGVYRLTGGMYDSFQKNVLQRENKYKGIKIDKGANGYEIDIYIIVEFGVRIPDISWNIQNQVKKQLEEVMDLKIAGIHIHVQGVYDGADIDDDTDDSVE
ncbi:MAG: Asp23/Gls24 family envelope stress response protein [Clostridiales Family XIII bacterium]|nr:Asp23/Gls24 family envelope stress response protein [Clostridiales Family XIII bacterium]